MLCRWKLCPCPSTKISHEIEKRIRKLLLVLKQGVFHKKEREEKNCTLMWGKNKTQIKSKLNSHKV